MTKSVILSGTPPQALTDMMDYEKYTILNANAIYASIYINSASLNVNKDIAAIVLGQGCFFWKH